MNLKDNDVRLETFGYFMFIALIAVFFLGTRICNKYDDMKKELKEVEMPDDYNPDSSLKAQFCENRNSLSLNMGVAFLVFTVGKAYYNRIQKKMKKQ